MRSASTPAHLPSTPPPVGGNEEGSAERLPSAVKSDRNRRRLLLLGLLAAGLLTAAAIVGVAATWSGPAGLTAGPRRSTPAIEHAITKPSARPSTTATPSATTTSGSDSGIAAFTDATLWDLDCANMPGADQAYTPGKVVIDASVQTQTENAASPSRIIAASCDGKWTSDEVKWFNGYPTTGMDSGVVLYPPNGTSTVQVARIQADGPDTVTAYGTITSADGKVSHFVDQYGEGAHGWVRDDHRVVTTGTQPSRTVLPGIDTVGYGPVRIGMSAADLESTGVVTQLNWRTLKDSGGPDNGCWDGQMTYEGHSAAVDFDPRTGTVQGITFTGGMATSRGIEMGSSAAAVQRAYPDAARQSGSGVNGYVTWTVPLPDHAAYRIETWSYKDFGVVTIAMVGASNPCGLG